MSHLKLICFAMIILAGCCGPTFTNLGNNVGVPTESIEDYAAAHGITRGEAIARMRAEADQRRIESHAEEHGISLEEAQKQLGHANR